MALSASRSVGVATIALGAAGARFALAIRIAGVFTGARLAGTDFATSSRTGSAAGNHGQCQCQAREQ